MSLYRLSFSHGTLPVLERRSRCTLSPPDFIVASVLSGCLIVSGSLAVFYQDLALISVARSTSQLGFHGGGDDNEFIPLVIPSIWTRVGVFRTQPTIIIFWQCFLVLNKENPRTDDDDPCLHTRHDTPLSRVSFFIVTSTKLTFLGILKKETVGLQRMILYLICLVVLSHWWRHLGP